MLTVGALILMALSGPALAQEPQPACPARTIGFSPPLDTPLLLTRRIERELANGLFVQTVTYALRFHRAGRGYRMHWQQVRQQASGPPELLRLFSLQDEGAEGETLDFTLDAQGALLGVTEAADAEERLDRAIARLRADPLMAQRSARERQMIDQLLDSMAALLPAERADMHMAKAARLLVLAGRGCADGVIMGDDNSGYRMTGGSGPGETIELVASASQPRADGSTLETATTLALSPATGLVESHDRRTISRVGAVTRASREWLRLTIDTAAPLAPGRTAAADPADPREETGR